MYIWWIFLILTYKTVANPSPSELVNNDDDVQVKVNPKKISQIKYLDGEIMIFQNQHKQSTFFFAPFPFVQHEETQCHENDLNNRIELGLQVELYTPQLIEAVKEYLYKHQSILCGNTTSSFICDISLSPINSIRLVQKNSHSTNTHQKYTLEDSWQSNTLLLQSMEFVIYVSNMTLCEQLRTTLTERCRLSNFEIHYSLHDQQTVQRQLDVNTEHISISGTNMYNQIRAQFPLAQSVLLTESDFRELLSQSTDRITMTLRSQEGFDSLQYPMTIEKLLMQQLSTQQVRLEMVNDKLWENLYWNTELTRPDRLAKILNSIIREDENEEDEDDDSENFIYNRKIAKDAMKHNSSNSFKHRNDQSGLTYFDKLRLRQIDQKFDPDNLQKVGIEKGRPFNNRVNNNDLDPLEIDTKDTNKQYILNRDEVEKFLRELSDNVYLDDDTIKPRLIKVRLVKIDKLSTNTKLFSNTILARMQSNIYKLPVRCKPSDNSNKAHKSKSLLSNRMDQIERLLQNLSNQVMKECVKMGQLDNLYINLTALIEEGSTAVKGDLRYSSADGPSGLHGLPGIPGNRGVNGQPGLPGLKGERGLNGIPGAPGLNGEPGLPGRPGLKGQRGFGGHPGVPGLNGERGFDGIPGLPGFNGDPGLPGITGAKGERGLPGAPGSLGQKGDHGLNGIPGAPGLNGDPGLPGRPGLKGVPGDYGLPGITGAKGDRGFDQWQDDE